MTYPDIDVMRSDISKMYTGPSWKDRVKRMSDSQVFAIWNKFYEQGKFNKKPKVCKTEVHIKEKRVDPVVTMEGCYGEQLAFDI